MVTTPNIYSFIGYDKHECLTLHLLYDKKGNLHFSIVFGFLNNIIFFFL